MERAQIQDSNPKVNPIVIYGVLDKVGTWYRFNNRGRFLALEGN